MKNPSRKPILQSHTSRSKIGMGDHYGSAIKQNIGRTRSSMMDIPNKSKAKKKPVTLA